MKCQHVQTKVVIAGGSEEPPQFASDLSIAGRAGLHLVDAAGRLYKRWNGGHHQSAQVIVNIRDDDPAASFQKPLPAPSFTHSRSPFCLALDANYL